MNFFQAQDQARRKTWQLALMFGAAVLTLIVLTNVLVAVALAWSGQQLGGNYSDVLAQTPASTWWWISAAVLGTIGVASLYKYLSIQGGGRAIAESLGGHLIHQNTRDTQQRQLLNVVEEMAIASGIAVPPVYLIPESSINAFAAGFSPADAVIGINQGTLDHLNRDELQGVVAHEFSHILNGDTNINLRLIAVLHGILFIGTIGYLLLRGGGMSRRNGLPVVALGAGLVAVGYGGVFFGNLIKAAVSRQREYLADASAVQFTRDPNGIADALKKIGGLPMRSHLQNQAAEEASHMFFGAAARKFSANLFATHPPLERRIKAIQPNWNGRFPTIEGASAPAAAVSASASPIDGLVSGLNQKTVYVTTQAEAVVDLVGQPNQDSIAVAQNLIADHGAELNAAAHDPFEARALIYAMLLDDDETTRGRQVDHLLVHAERGVPAHLSRLRQAVSHSDALHRLTLLEMSIPALKELSPDQYRTFSRNAAQLITADGQIDIHEWVLHRLLVKALHPHFEGPQTYHGRVRHVSRLKSGAATLLSILACAGHTESDDQVSAYQAGMQALDLEHPFTPHTQFDYGLMNTALSKLRKLRALAKPELIKACAVTVLDDGHISADEGALLQGVAATLDCPLPPSIYAADAATDRQA